MSYEIAALAILILFSAFFSGAEIALFSLGRAHVRALVERGASGAKAVARLKANPERLLVTILIGNNIVNIGAAALATSLAMRLLGDYGVGVATGVMTFLILVFGEITPKTFAYRWAESYALFFARALEIFAWIIFPLAWLLEGLTRRLTRTSGTEQNNGIGHKGLLSSMAKMALEEGGLSASEHRLVESAVRLDRIPADRVMTPRSDMEVVEAEKTLREAIATVTATPYSRYPVYRGDLDEIVGVLHLRDLYEHLRSGEDNKTVESIAAKPFFVPRTMVIGDLLRHFQRQRIHIAIVIGEYAETAGLVTLEDVLEEMVGEIEDETDDVRKRIHKLGEGRWLIDATLPIEDVQRAIGIELPTESHHTINGLLIGTYRDIPGSGTEIEAGGHSFVVRRADRRRVILAELIIAKPPEES